MEQQTEGRLYYFPLHLVQPGVGGRSRPGLGLQELAASIRQVGILQPLTVKPQGSGYVVVSGNRRLAAARMAGLTEVPCLLLLRPGLDEALIALTENLQREDLHYLEEAALLQDFIRQGKLTQAEAARRLGRSQSAVGNKLRLLGHSARVRQALRESGLSERHARALLRVEGETARLRVLREIRDRHFSVSQTERYIDTYLQNTAASGEKLRRRDTRLFLERLQRETGTLRSSGVEAELQSREEQGALVVLLRIAT